MKIGHARVCLTPKKTFHLIGYRSDNRWQPATGVHDDIYANALLFEEDGQEVFIFSADILEFEESMAEDVKTILQEAFGIERDLVLLCGTHDHSSVVSYHRSWYTGKFDQEYYDFFVQAIVDCYTSCRTNKETAFAKYGRKIIKGYYGNRNHPGELADNEVVVLKFFDAQNRAFAGIVNWAVHSTVISAENTELTSDLAGEVSKKLAASFGFYPAMIVGAAGDCSNRNERQGNDFAELERVSSGLADVISEIATTSELSMGGIRYQTLYHTLHRNNFHLDVKFEVINMGDLQIFSFPGELGSAFGKELKAISPDLGLIAGYTNGYQEYFLPAEEYGLSFETKDSKVPLGEPEKIIRKFIESAKYLNTYNF